MIATQEKTLAEKAVILAAHEEKLAEKAFLLAEHQDSQVKLQDELEQTRNSTFEEMESTAEELAKYKDEIDTLTQQYEEVLNNARTCFTCFGLKGIDHVAYFCWGWSFSELKILFLHHMKPWLASKYIFTNT